MVKYLISRLLLVFLYKFFTNWAFNIESQLTHFFDLREGYFFNILSFLTMYLILGLGLFTINLLFSKLYLEEKTRLDQFIKKTGESGFEKTIKIFIENFWLSLRQNFKIQIKLEKYPILFLTAVSIFYLIKGNPIFNNYYGIYTYRYTGYKLYYEEIPHDIVHKSKRIENYDDEKEGYLFFQAALISGYKTYNNKYKGFLSYIECLLFFALEKLINTIMYFFIPFATCISIYHYKFENKKCSIDNSQKK